MRPSPPLLRVDGLSLSLSGLPVLHRVSFDLERGACMALVGESGCGKTMTGLAILGLVPGIRGRIEFHGQNLVEADKAVLRSLRGGKMAMIFQDARSALNPFLRLSEQLIEGYRLHRGATEKEALHRATAILEQVGLPHPASRIHLYPHQFSGGMLQRIMIAMAVMTEPDLIIADEPTSALDVTIQAQTLEVLDRLRAAIQSAVLLITHDLGVVAGRSDSLAVMYAGRIVEYGATEPVLREPAHPYMRALLDASLAVSGPRRERLVEIPGQPPSPAAFGRGCPFGPRCTLVSDPCLEEAPPLVKVREGRLAACWFPFQEVPDRAPPRPSG